MVFTRPIIFFLFLSFPCFLSGQSELSVFSTTGRGAVATPFVHDYQALGINPANLGWDPEFEDKSVALGFMEGGYSFYAKALSKKTVRDEMTKFNNILSWKEKEEAARQFAEGGVAANVSAMYAGGAVQGEKLGGLAFNVRERGNMGFRLNETMADILFKGFHASYFDKLVLENGDTISNTDDLSADTLDKVKRGFTEDPDMLGDLMEGSRASMAMYRMYNVGYGRRVMGSDALSLYGGIGVKYVQGTGLLELQAEDGDLEAFSALSPGFGIDYGSAAKRNPSFEEGNGGFPLQAVGSGLGFDVGFNAVIGDHIKAGLAFNDMGSVTWDGNVFTAVDTLVIDTRNEGMDSYNIIEELDKVAADSSLFKWEGKKEKAVALPSTFRIGGGLVLGDPLEVGVDLVVPMNDAPGSYDQPIYSLGARLKALPWLELSAGVMTGGNREVIDIPVGLLYQAPMGGYEAGIASRDLVTFFTQTGPTVSLSMGFLRFRF